MDSKIKRGGTVLFWLCWIAYTTSYITRLNYSTAMSTMITEGLFDKTFGGYLGTGFFACYGLGQLANGFLGDRIKPKYMIGIGITASGIMNLLMALLADKYALLAVWCVNGYCCSMLWAPVIRCFSEYMVAEKRNKAGVSISSTIPLGGIISYLLSSLVLGMSGSYRMLFTASGIIGIAVGALWIFGMNSLSGYFADVKPIIAAENGIASGSDTAIRKDNRSFFVLLATTGALLAMVCIFFNGVLKDGVTLWIPTLLSDGFVVSPSVASLVITLLPIVNLAGAYVARFLDRRFFRNELTTVCFMFGLSFVAVFLLYLIGSLSVVLAAFLVAACTSSMLGANSMLLTFIPLSYSKIGRSSSITGFFDACSYLASAVSSPVIALVSENYGWDITVLSWCGVALAGALFAGIGIPLWKKGREKI